MDIQALNEARRLVFLPPKARRGKEEKNQQRWRLQEEHPESNLGKDELREEKLLKDELLERPVARG